MFEHEKNAALSAVTQHPKLADTRLLFLYIAGSVAYGVNTPESDIDFRGVYLDHKASFLGLGSPDKSITIPTYDTVIHPLEKTVHMLSKCNPNIIEMLGIRPEHIAFIDPLFQRIIDNAELFLSKKALAASTCGFVKSEMDRIYSGTGTPAQTAKKMYHVLRLLYMATDILLTGKVETYREKERGFLMDVRVGKYQDKNGMPLSAFIVEYESQKSAFTSAYSVSVLPDEPKTPEIIELVWDIFAEQYTKNKNQ